MRVDLRLVRSRLQALAADARREHQRADQQCASHLVRPSIPILYFGDSELYQWSALRILTVGLNPSREEFPHAAPFSRFLEPPDEDIDRTAYLSSLDNYFRVNPYMQWFNPSFEPLLQSLDASYYDGPQSRALHTDLCSPLPTDPTWSRLYEVSKAFLQPAGVRLWHQLTEALEPDVVLISIARRLLNNIIFPVTVPVSTIHTVTGAHRSPYRIEAWRCRLVSGKETLFIFGQAAQTPFGLISARDKARVGPSILAALRRSE